MPRSPRPESDTHCNRADRRMEGSLSSYPEDRWASDEAFRYSFRDRPCRVPYLKRPFCKKFAKTLHFGEIFFALQLPAKVDETQPEQISIECVGLVVLDDSCQVAVEPEIGDLIAFDVDLPWVAAQPSKFVRSEE